MAITRSVVVRWWCPGSYVVGDHRAWQRTFPASRTGLTRARNLARMAVKRGRAYASWYITETIP